MRDPQRTRVVAAILANQLARFARRRNLADPNDRLSRAASVVWHEVQHMIAAANDIAWGAPGECLEVVERGCRRRMIEGLARLGYTPESFDREANARVSGYWFHKHSGSAQLALEL